MDVKQLLYERGIRPSRGLGQYFLIDENVARRMVEYAGVGCEDVILEIGAGLGSLTEQLVGRAKKVYAVEKDTALCEVLRARYQNQSRIEVLEGDIMKLKLPAFDKVVASIPFALSSPLTYKLLLHKQGFGLAVLLYQREFTQKLIATPNTTAYGRISVITQVLAEVEVLEVVHRDAFYPSPPVTTALVRLKEKKERLVNDTAEFFAFVTEAYDQRRKKLRWLLKGCHAENTELAEKRPEELSPSEFAELTNYLRPSRGVSR
ncbi:MAG: ribosomal RNA small subunit methyltransferase A [Methanophagales archaeon ANME-1-THS]|nr:MAG: ribosomal RNA small subunit methyltransferase A [Methanophagales archaeon ANME-1-THS]